MTDTIVQRYEPRGAARRLLSTRDDEVLLSGAAGTGKTMGALMKMHLVAMKYERMRGLIVRKTAASLGSTTLDIWRKAVIAPSEAIGEVVYYGGSNAEPPQYRYLRNGSIVAIGGMDKPSKIMSSEYDLIFVDEATELLVQDWEALTTRARNGRLPYQQVYGACNPDAEHHWLKQRSNTGQTKLMESRHEDNPRYFNRDGSATEEGRAYIARLDKLTGVRYWRLRKGLWVAAEGLVYEAFDPVVHCIDWPPKGFRDWPRYWAVDFGYTNPFVLQCWAEDPDGRLYLYREIYMTHRLVEDHARQILSIVAPGGVWNEPRPHMIICDHDAEDRATLERHLGMGTTPAHKTVSDGIQAVQVRLKAAGDGKPRFYYVRQALVERDAGLAERGLPTSTLEEFTSYVWRQGLDGKPVPDEPLKKDDHGMDAARYMVAQKDLAGVPSMRVLKLGPRR